MANSLHPKVNFTVVSDPGHAWLIVAPQWVGTVGLNVGAFSHYSYVGDDGTLALEEDRDAKVFLDAYERNFGNTYDLQDVYEPRAQIRDWVGLQQIAA
ncbi:hypothetical protein RA27_18250 [Ruegeria sp. ANG-R]|uniref:hypothetical protein n=1 Tax=Ruegeria sp. ANG-R TaxID=1577903 RepID=UPI00057C4E86|nr:hypothetical protein [Ruegeria sp. ANG-R]KIC38835.1 hypothetical protein RA27_18250 [Ruegeria sp. ANG-R]